MKRSISVLFILLIFLAVPARPVQAALCTLTWIGPANGNWNSISNWSPDANCTSATLGPDVILQFGNQGSYPSRNNLTADVTLNQIVFIGQNITLTRVNMVKVTLTNGISLGPSASADIQMPVAFSGSPIVDAGSLSELTLSGVVSGVGPINKLGTGALVLSAANTITGGTSIAASSVELRNNAVPGAGPVVVTAGASLILGQGMTSLNNSIILSGTGAGGNGALRVSSAANLGITLVGPVALTGGGARIQNDGSIELTLDGVIGGTGDLTLAGGWFRFHGSSPNTYNGRLTLASGTLDLDAPAGTKLITGALDLGPGTSLFNWTIVNTNQDNLFDPASLVTFHRYSHLDLKATNQTLGALRGSYLDDQPCEVAVTGSLTLLGAGPANFGCEAIGAGRILVTGSGNQTFTRNNRTFSGSIEVLGMLPNLAVGYLSGYQIAGSYTLHGNNGAGGLYPNSRTGDLLVDGAWFYSHSPFFPTDTPPRVSKVNFSGQSAYIFLNFYSTTFPVLISDGPVNLGNGEVRANICYGAKNSAQLPIVPAIGEPYVVIENTSTFPTTGAFLGLPEGGLGKMGPCLGNGQEFPYRITYTGGKDGNDLVIDRMMQVFLPMIIR